MPQTKALLGNEKGAGPKLVLHNLYLGVPYRLGLWLAQQLIWADEKPFSLADNSLEVYAEDTVYGRKINKSFRFLQQRADNQKSETVNFCL